MSHPKIITPHNQKWIRCQSLRREEPHGWSTALCMAFSIISGWLLSGSMRSSCLTCLIKTKGSQSLYFYPPRKAYRYHSLFNPDCYICFCSAPAVWLLHCAIILSSVKDTQVKCAYCKCYIKLQQSDPNIIYSMSCLTEPFHRCISMRQLLEFVTFVYNSTWT